MIFDENEIRQYGREKRVMFPVKKQPEKPKQQQGTDNTPILIASIRAVFDLISDIKNVIKFGFNSLDSKIDSIKIPQPKEPEKKPDKWEFTIKRDIDNRILKIEARRM